jgi:hypothetical protein
MKRVLVLSSLLFCSVFAMGQSFLLSQFKDSIVPKTGKGDLYDINKSPKKFIVSSPVAS